MSFPKCAKDVVEIVNHANKFNQKVSIKNSGHSYTAGSTSADSVQINLRDYPKYSFTDVYACEEGTDYEPLVGPPCKLALARGKTATARIGGGQGNDDMFRSVIDFNYKVPRDKRYFALGGAEGMVGGGGGFMQGGGLGMGEERLYGNGADQVLELEMVLPDGTHVKFGPTEWETKEGFIYPQTTKVEGRCNNNVDFDESRWEWVDCPDGRPSPDVTFEDLWFAVRGGGGGAWGVVLSSYQQLHDLVPQFTTKTDLEGAALGPLLERCQSLESEGVSTCDALVDMAQTLWIDFVIDLLWNAENNEIGVDEDLSLHCGFTSGSFQNPITAVPSINCHGHGIREKFQEAWKTSIAKSSYVLPEYQDPPMKCALENLIYLEGGYFDRWRRDMLQSYPLSFGPIGRFRDNSGPEGAYTFPFTVWGLMIPESFFASKTEQVFEFLKSQPSGHTLPYAFASDGMTPQPKLYRSGGFQTHLFPNHLPFDLLDKLFNEDLTFKCQRNEDNERNYHLAEESYANWIANFLSHLEDYDPSSGDHPGLLEYNHIYANSFGFLKSNSSKPCPFVYTMEERQANCFSVQESVFGTENFKRLTAIKEAIDPKKLFDVYFGIGNDERSGPIYDSCASYLEPSGPSYVWQDESPASPILEECSM